MELKRLQINSSIKSKKMHLNGWKENGLIKIQNVRNGKILFKINKKVLPVQFNNCPEYFSAFWFEEDSDYNDSFFSSRLIPKPIVIEEKLLKRNLIENRAEVDYIEKHINQTEIGLVSENRVIEFEKKFLTSKGKHDLTERVKSVSKDASLGFDVLSFELNGEEKHIEVKTIKIIDGKYSFFITDNEVSKSKLLPNYYIYCVENPRKDDFKISFLKNPELQDGNLFLLKPMNYQVFFEV